MNAQSQPSNAEQLYNLIQARTGLVLTTHQRTDVSVIWDELQSSGSLAPAENLLVLLSNNRLSHPLWRRIILAITVGETYFFRNQAQFDVLRDHILPDLIAERRKSDLKHLRLWSAGSATGEEPYSLAILLRELLPDIETWSVTVLASDINESYLEYARRGVYGSRSFRSETPADLRERWFVPTPEGHLLQASVRNMVIFKHQNLALDDYPALETNTMFVDIIMCRNVTIYFERETTRQIATRFQRALNPNGWLVVGHSEPQTDLYQGFIARNFKHTVLYQKVADAVHSAPISTSLAVQSALKPTRQPAATRATLSPRPQPSPVVPTSSTEDFWMQAKVAADLELWDEACAWLDKAEQVDPFQPQTHYLRALVALHQGNTQQSLRLLRQSVYCDAEFALAHYALGNLYFQQGAHKEALRHWQFAFDSVEKYDPLQVLPYSDDLTVEMLVEQLAVRLSEL